jgi:hypothetical protein
MDGMIFSEASIIIIWTYQDISGHDGTDEQDIGLRNGWC